MDTYILRFVQRDASQPEKAAGLLEEVSSQVSRPFRSMDELTGMLCRSGTICRRGRKKEVRDERRAAEDL